MAGVINCGFDFVYYWASNASFAYSCGVISSVWSISYWFLNIFAYGYFFLTFLQEIICNGRVYNFFYSNACGGNSVVYIPFFYGNINILVYNTFGIRYYFEFNFRNYYDKKEKTRKTMIFAPPLTGRSFLIPIFIF